MSDVTTATRERVFPLAGRIGDPGHALTATERRTVQEEIVSFLADECDRDRHDIGPDTDLVDDLGVDSLTFLDLFQELEGRYDLDLDVRVVARYARDNPVRTVGELAEHICRFLENTIDLGAN